MIMKYLLCSIAFGLTASVVLAGDKSKPIAERVEFIKKLEEGAVKDAIKMPKGKADFKWRLFSPEGAGKSNRLPLVVFLHGAGKRGDDNIGPMALAWEFINPEAQKKHPCFVLAGQVQKGREWTPFCAKRDLLRKKGKKIKITDEMTALLSVVDNLVKERDIDVKRIYIVGQSMGGYGTWDALERRPKFWAAAVPICGGGTPEKAGTFKDTPIWAWHGAKDNVVSPENSRAMIEALKKAGGKPIYTEIPDCGHSAWDVALADPKLFDWLFKQKRK